MKYIAVVCIIIILLWSKPWQWLGTSMDSNVAKDSSALMVQRRLADSLLLLPANQVINNEDSELEMTRKFDRLIERFIQKWELKGVSFALMKDDRLIYSKGYGYADLEKGIPMDVMHVFRIASISKLITAVGIMKLQEEGKLKLSDCVFGPQGILNDSVFSDIKDKRSCKITIEHLLRHQGGYTLAYGDPMFNPLLIAKKMNVQPPADLNTMIRYVLSRRLQYTPGTSSAYSNIGYGILSRVIEKASGMDYETYIRKHILLPAGCFDMHLGKNLYEEKLPNEVKYYEVPNAEQIPACDGSGEMAYRSNGGNNIEELYGAGGWVASPSELLRFLATIDNDSSIPDILTSESIEYMTSNVDHGLPIGWIETTKRGDWMRTGTLAGTSALMKRQKDGYSWVFLTNTSSWKGSRFPNYINRAVGQAMATVKEWPERDLFEMQSMDNEKLLVNVR
ncbi:MAG: beta-lactamase family protein [Odoribacter sp.]|nr:beta-lactamase family protein [Odoribacter sp.]